MEVTHRELELLNFYRASELQGGLVLGQLVRRARDAELILQLTRHSAEEIVHAELWTETILAVGGAPFATSDTYQRRYAAALGPPSTLFEVLALTQVFERRVYRHFVEHLRRPGTHPRVQRTLARMLEEEKGHLSWVKRWLEAQARTRPDLVRTTLRRYARVDAAVYAALTERYGWSRAA